MRKLKQGAAHGRRDHVWHTPDCQPHNSTKCHILQHACKAQVGYSAQPVTGRIDCKHSNLEGLLTVLVLYRMVQTPRVAAGSNAIPSTSPNAVLTVWRRQRQAKQHTCSQWRTGCQCRHSLLAQWQCMTHAPIRNASCAVPN